MFSMRIHSLFCIFFTPLLVTCTTPVKIISSGDNSQLSKTLPSPVEPKNPEDLSADSREGEKRAEISASERAEITQEKKAVLPEASPEGEFTPEEILNAFMKAYPDKIEKVVFQEGDWSIQVNGRWFFWASGRLLPENLSDKALAYDPYPFYEYPGDLPEIHPLTEKEMDQLNSYPLLRASKPLTRYPEFYNSLWQVHDRRSSWEKAKTIYFLGMKVEIHRELLEDLAMVEEDIQTEMENDKELSQFVKSIYELHGYNWRKIAGTETLSVHSYGIAIDVVPANYSGKQAYWLWAKSLFKNWYILPYSERFMPPVSFVRAFEKHGFIWGGKWTFFDNIHFEYRPEILLLNNVERGAP